MKKIIAIKISKNRRIMTIFGDITKTYDGNEANGLVIAGILKSEGFMTLDEKAKARIREFVNYKGEPLGNREMEVFEFVEKMWNKTPESWKDLTTEQILIETGREEWIKER